MVMAFWTEMPNFVSIDILVGFPRIQLSNWMILIYMRFMQKYSIAWQTEWVFGVYWWQFPNQICWQILWTWWRLLSQLGKFTMRLCVICVECCRRGKMLSIMQSMLETNFPSTSVLLWISEWCWRPSHPFQSASSSNMQKFISIWKIQTLIVICCLYSQIVFHRKQANKSIHSFSTRNVWCSCENEERNAQKKREHKLKRDFGKEMIPLRIIPPNERDFLRFSLLFT